MVSPDNSMATEREFAAGVPMPRGYLAGTEGYAALPSEAEIAARAYTG